MNINRGYRKSSIPAGAKRVFEGKIFDVYHWEQLLYDNTTMTFERLARPDTIVVFPVLPDGTIVLIQDTQPDRDTVLTAPSGRMEDGEKPEETALRELKEETGLTPKILEPFYSYAPYRKIDWMIHVFIAKGCTKVSEPKLDAGERITLNPVSFDELIELAVRGDYHNDEFDTLVLRAKLDPRKMDELRAKFLS